MNIDRHKIRKQKGFELRKARKQAGLSQDSLSGLSGLHQATISKMELGLEGWNIDSEILYMTAIINHINKVS